MGDEKTNKDKVFFLLTGGNVSYMYLFKKTERVAEACMLVVGHLPPEDHFRTRIEEGALRLPEMALAMTEDLDTKRFASHLINLTSLIALAVRARKLSPRNGSILEEECHTLLGFLEERRDEVIYPESGSGEGAEGDDLSTLERKVLPWKRHALRNVRIPPRISKGQFSPIEISKKPDDFKKPEHFSALLDIRHSTRREKILGVVDKKIKVTIKDILDSIKDCSEKTVQRELVFLVESGVLKKEGERRWSVYSRSLKGGE